MHTTDTSGEEHEQAKWYKQINREQLGTQNVRVMSTKQNYRLQNGTRQILFRGDAVSIAHSVYGPLSSQFKALLWKKDERGWPADQVNQERTVSDWWDTNESINTNCNVLAVIKQKKTKQCDQTRDILADRSKPSDTTGNGCGDRQTKDDKIGERIRDRDRDRVRDKEWERECHQNLCRVFGVCQQNHKFHCQHGLKM